MINIKKRLKQIENDLEFAVLCSANPLFVVKIYLDANTFEVNVLKHFPV